MIKIGSLFAGIGGFELGLERAIPNSETVWQVEQEPFCQKILKKHWPHSKIYNDVRAVGAHNLEQVDIICGGFPCQDISQANATAKGLEGEKSGLWFEMLRIISELRPRVAIMENVPAIYFRGLSTVLGGLSEIGYDVEWRTISARQFGAPHLRRRWFAVAYPNSNGKPISPFNDEMAKLQELKTIDVSNPNSKRPRQTFHSRSSPYIDLQSEVFQGRPQGNKITPNTNSTNCSTTKLPIRKTSQNAAFSMRIHQAWGESYCAPKILRILNGVSTKLDRSRLKALGNAIVPQCSEYIGRHIFESGVLS